MTAQLLVLTCRHVLDFTPLVLSFALSRYGFRYGAEIATVCTLRLGATRQEQGLPAPARVDKHPCISSIA